MDDLNSQTFRLKTKLKLLFRNFKSSDLYMIIIICNYNVKKSSDYKM